MIKWNGKCYLATRQGRGMTIELALLNLLRTVSKDFREREKLAIAGLLDNTIEVIDEQL